MSTYNIIIVLPGTTGSTLILPNTLYNPAGIDATQPVWPNQVIGSGVLEPATDAAKLEQLLYPGIVQGWFNLLGAYGSLGSYLRNQMGDNCAYWSAECPFLPLSSLSAPPTTAASNNWGLPTVPLTSPAVIGYPYDWRQDNLTLAQIFRNFLYTLNSLYSASIGNIYLVAHSMGGILSRTYLEVVGSPTNNGGYDPLYGNIKSLITLGTPHLGAPLALDAIVGNLDIARYFDVTGLEEKLVLPDAEAMVTDFIDNTKYPSVSTYELLPPPPGANWSSAWSSANIQNVNFILDSEVKGGAYSAFGPFTNAPHLASKMAGEDYASDLDNAKNNVLVPLSNALNSSSAPTSVAYYCIYGVSSLYPTLTSVSYTYPLGFSDNPQNSGGDQVVPTWSATFGGAPFLADAPYMATTVSPTISPQPPANSVNHLQLPGSPDAQAKIAGWLGL